MIPATKGSTAKSKMVKLMAKYKAPKQAQYNVFTQHSMMVDEQERLDEQGAQAGTELQNEMDKYKEKNLMESSSSLRNPYGHRHSGADNSGDGSKKLPKPSQKGRGFRNLFIRKGKGKPKKSPSLFQEKNKLQGFFDKYKTKKSVGPSGSLKTLYEPQHGTTNDWGEDSVGPLSFSGAPYEPQHGTTNDWGEDPMGPPSSVENPYGHQHSTTNNWEKDSVGSLSSSGAPYKYPHGTTNNWGEDSVGSPSSSGAPYKYPHGTTNNRGEDPMGPPSSLENPYKYPHGTTNDWGEDPMGPPSSLENPYKYPAWHYQ
ncbi:hypothetical protein BASA62_005391 [Batrachochytrium salamandrivorans]|nr:hypothetical protein BASA62_005391 [Batrachochytrium salamandrivorans]